MVRFFLQPLPRMKNVIVLRSRLSRKGGPPESDVQQGSTSIVDDAWHVVILERPFHAIRCCQGPDFGFSASLTL